MKNLFLSACMCLGVSLFGNAQSSSNGGCPSNSTFIQASCVSGCYSVSYITGDLEFDLKRFKPSPQQVIEITEDLNRKCKETANSPFNPSFSQF